MSNITLLFKQVVNITLSLGSLLMELKMLPFVKYLDIPGFTPMLSLVNCGSAPENTQSKYNIELLVGLVWE